MIHDQTQVFLDEHKMIYRFQSGFRKIFFTDFCLSSNEVKTFDDKDLPWIISDIKKMIIEKNDTSKKSKKNVNKQTKIKSLR